MIQKTVQVYKTEKIGENVLTKGERRGIIIKLSVRQTNKRPNKTRDREGGRYTKWIHKQLIKDLKNLN